MSTWLYNIAVTPIVAVRAPIILGLRAVALAGYAIATGAERASSMLANVIPGWRSR